MIGRRLAEIVAVIGSLMLAGCGGSSADDQPDETRASLTGVAKVLQGSLALDYEPLEVQNLSLTDVAKQSDIVGVGKIVDVRLGYETRFLTEDGDVAPDSVRRMFIVIQPDELAAGADLLGKSGEVLLDVPAPAVNRDTETRGVDELKTSAVEAPGRVLFMLRLEPAPTKGTLTADDYAGRAEDDPLFLTTHPSSFLGLGDDGVAFPLLTTEKIEGEPMNLSAFEGVGVDIKSFDVVESNLATAAP